MRTQVYTYATALAAALALKLFVFPDAAEHGRFFEASKTYLIPVILVVLVAFAALWLYVVVKRPSPGQQKKMIDVSFWTTTAILTIAVASVIASVKLGIV